MLYQLTLAGNGGLDVSLPESLKPAASPRLSRAAACYICFAKMHEADFLNSNPEAKNDTLQNFRSAQVMYFMTSGPGCGRN